MRRRKYIKYINEILEKTSTAGLKRIYDFLSGWDAIAIAHRKKKRRKRPC